MMDLATLMAVVRTTPGKSGLSATTETLTIELERAKMGEGVAHLATAIGDDLRYHVNGSSVVIEYASLLTRKFF